MVKAGYKQTEVGLIPEDWEVKSIGEIVDVDPDNLSSSTNPEYRFKYISLEDVDYGTLRNISELVFKHAPSRARRKLKKDDVLVSTVRPNLKSHLLITEEVSDWICSTGFSVLRCRTEITYCGFIFYHFFASVINRQIDNMITGSNYPAINSKEVKSLRIPYPISLSEQTAIANALSDADALISSLEKLIAKKRAIKQGAMQKLLTPQEGWEVKKLGEIAEVKSGKRLPLGTSLTETETTHPYIRILDMSNGGVSLSNIMYVPEDVFPSISNYRIFSNDIYISVAGTLGLVGRIPDVLDGANLTENANRLTAIKCNIDYLLDVLKSNLIQNKIDAERTLGAQPKLALTRIRNFEIPLPTAAFQNQIATILFDLETEIKILETKLEKFRNVKLGMMQQLLTGKIRIV